MANGQEFQPQFDRPGGIEVIDEFHPQFYRPRGTLDQLISMVNHQGSNFDTTVQSQFSQPRISVETLNNPGGMMNHQVGMETIHHPDGSMDKFNSPMVASCHFCPYKCSEDQIKQHMIQFHYEHVAKNWKHCQFCAKYYSCDEEFFQHKCFLKPGECGICGAKYSKNWTKPGQDMRRVYKHMREEHLDLIKVNIH